MSEFNNLISMLNEKNDIILSQQAKIEEINKTIVLLNAGLRKNKANKHKLLAKNIELQKRIDEALRHVVDHGGYDDLTHVINILKGNKDEN